MRALPKLAFLFLLIGCASGGGGGGGGGGEEAVEGDQDMYVLTAERLSLDPSLTAREAIRRHRRFWKTDNIFLQGNTRPETGPVLDQWMATDILMMRYYRDADAMTKFGPSYTSAIEVLLRR